MQKNVTNTSAKRNVNVVNAPVKLIIKKDWNRQQQSVHVADKLLSPDGRDGKARSLAEKREKRDRWEYAKIIKPYYACYYCCNRHYNDA